MEAFPKWGRCPIRRLWINWEEAGITRDLDSCQSIMQNVLLTFCWWSFIRRRMSLLEIVASLCGGLVHCNRATYLAGHHYLQKTSL